MSFTDILGFFKGSVTIEAEGGFLERFLNICMRRGIYLSDITHESSEKIRARIGIGGFREIRPIAKKTRTRVRIRRRAGLPFLLHRYKNRRFAIVGVAVFLGILWYLSTHIVGIDIWGNQRLLTKDIEVGLKEFGLYRGIAVSKIDNKLLQNKMMTRFDDIAWIGINIKGSRAFVEVKERLDTKRIVDKDIPCNIVAARSGIVKEVIVHSGQTMIKAGDMVEEGDLLVSGVMDSGVMGIRWAHSEGVIKAETTYKKTKKYPLEFTEKQYSGNEKKRRSIEVFGKRLNLYLKDSAPFEYCDKVTDKTGYSWFSKDAFAMGITVETYKEYTPIKRKRTQQEAVDLGKKELSFGLEQELAENVEIKERKLSFKELPQKMVEVTVEFVCNEDIALKEVVEKM